MKKQTLYKMTESAILVALAVVLSFFKISIGGFGGSIDFVMIPLFVVCYRHGVSYGVAAGLVFGFVKCIIGGGIGWGLPSVLLDYVLAYGAIGVAGIFKGKSKLLELSALLGCFARFIIHFISGITIYMITVPTEIAGSVIANPVLYSVVYNALYMLPNTIIAIVVMSLLRYPLKRLKKV
jgi:thiamine transporter